MSWQPIETAPKDGTAFLAYWQNGAMPEPEIIVAAYIDDWQGFYGLSPRDLGGRRSIVDLRWGFPEMKLCATHWMPLPLPPQTILDGGGYVGGSEP